MNSPFFRVAAAALLFFLFCPILPPLFAGGRADQGGGALSGEDRTGAEQDLEPAAAGTEDPAEPVEAAAPQRTEEAGEAAEPSEVPGGVEAGDAASAGAGEEDAAETPAEEGAGDGDEAESPVEEEPPPLDPAVKIREMDIKTSTLTELAAWCRSLGLSEGGNKEELARRIREYFEMPPPEAMEEDASRKIITIESARSTEYFTLDVVDEEYARLRGDVLVSLKDGDAVHRIKAWEILYNRTRNLISATGGVEYIKEAGDTIETFRGDSITVNLDNWSSIFLDGISERSLQSSATTYRFAGTVISRNEEEVTVLTRASISNANNEEAFWSLNASKLWLLPGSDFAIFNAVLKVGEIPVLYFPFFYYPADEVVFHPVLGYRSREGNFIQTTTYILGRPRASSTSESSITKILGNSADMEKRREGLFLRSTGKKITDPDETMLKVLVDIYANLGTYLGTDLTLPRKGIFSATDLSAGVGFTRNIKPMGDSNYTPFPNYDGVSEWNSANLFSWDVPFRYRLKTSGSLGGSYGSLSWNFPYYSDPFVDRDFLNRTEEMDWVHMIQEGAALEEETTTENLLGAYEWRLNGSFRPPSLPFLAPYISDISLSSITSTISFRTRNLLSNNPSYKDYAPDRSFFYPDKFTLYSLSGSIGGTPLTLGGGSGNQAAAAVEETEAEDPLKSIGTPRSPWEKAGEEQRRTEADKLIPPVLNQRFDLPRLGGPQFSIDYRITPTTVSELQFRSSERNWPEYDKIDWSQVSSILSTFGGNASTSFNLSHAGGGAYSNVFTFSGSGSWQNYTYINEEAEEYTTIPAAGQPAVADPAKINAARERTYSQSYFTTSYAYTSTFRPLYQSTVWGNSSLQYSFGGLLAKSAFIGTGEDPKWEVVYGAWDKDNLDSHQISATVAASIMDKVQNLVFSADLPPEDSSVSGNATFRVWISETNAHTRILFPGEEDKRKFEPFYTTETLRFGNLGSLQQYMVFDPEIKEYTTLTTTLSLSVFSAAYTMTRSKPYLLNYNGSVDSTKPDGWIQQDNEGLYPRDLTLNYRQTFRKDSLWKNRLSFSLNFGTSLYFDLQRYTNSRLNFSLGFTLGINNFLELSLSTTSDNSVIYRYFKGLPFFDFPSDLPSGEQDNFFIDLANSFRFDDEVKRRSSGFKLKSFNLSMTHHLGDWNAILGVTLSPYLDRPTGQVPVYKFNNEISFVVQWIPISEIKTDVRYTKEEWIVK